MTGPDTTPKLTDDEITDIASEFERQDFSDDEVATIKRTRRRSPTLGEERAEVYSFRAPPSYKRRIKKRAEEDRTSQAQVVRDALDAYLG